MWANTSYGFSLKTFCKKGWGPAQPEQKLAKNTDRAANMTLSFKRTPIKTVSGQQSWVWQMQTGIWNSLKHSLWLWGFGHIKLPALGLSIYETRWFWRYLCQQNTALCLRCGTAEWMSSKAAQKTDHSQSVCVNRFPPFCIRF